MPVPTKLEQNFNITPPRYPTQPSTRTENSDRISDEAYRTYNKLVDPEGIFQNKLARMLYSSVLVKSETFDPASPMEGYKLVLLGGKNRKPAMNWEGYNMVASSFILLASEVVSTTEFDTKEIQLKEVCIDGIFGIIDMALANRRKWQISDPQLYVPLGTAMWFNLYGLCRRSTGGGKMLMFITGLFKFLGHGSFEDQEQNSKVRFWSRGRANG